MNHTALGFLTVEKAVEGFLQFKIAEGLSNNTITSYRQILELYCSQIGEITVSEIVSRDIVEYLSWLRVDYKPKRMNNDFQPLSNKTLRNHWICLSSFFRWFSNEFEVTNPMISVPSPKFQTKEVEPFTKNEIEVLIKACEYSKKADTKYRETYRMRRFTALRDKSIMLTLLDTGLRASEFCSLRIADFEFKTGKLVVRHGKTGGAKGGKGRIVYLGKAARKILWRYLMTRDDAEEPDAPLYLSVRRRGLTTNGLRQLMASLGEKAKVKNCYPHRFRHTFAITYLRSGGDIFTLQSILGHNSLDMVRHYAKVAQLDIEQAHRKASPVDNWQL